MIQGRLRVDDSPVGKFGSGVDYKPQCSGNVSLIAALYSYIIAILLCRLLPLILEEDKKGQLI